MPNTVYYLAQPYSNDPAKAITLAFECCYELEFRKGLTVYSPVRETHFFHLNLLQLGLSPLDYIKRDLAILYAMMKDAVMLMSHTAYEIHNFLDFGAEKIWFSDGCRREYEFAKEWDIPVYELEAFLVGEKVEI